MSQSSQPTAQHNLNPNENEKSKKIVIQNQIPNEATATLCQNTYSNYLQTLNVDCLWYISQYLSIVDVVRLASTCKKLQYFAKTEFFPSKAKQIVIVRELKTFSLKTPLISNAFVLKQKNPAAFFRYFGEFVKDLTFEGLHEIGNILENCPKLTSICLSACVFTANETHALHVRLEELEDLKNLELLRCCGITLNWPAATFTENSNVEKLTMSATEKFNATFFAYFKNLLSLHIDFGFCTDWQIDDLAKVFDTTGQRLQRLKLQFINSVPGYETVNALIAEKLPHLESLALGFKLKDNSKHLSDVLHLTSLFIECETHNIDTLMRTLSSGGIIEDITIFNGFFAAEEISTPLTFHRLKSFRWFYPDGMTGFLKLMSKTHAPVMNKFLLTHIQPESLQDVLEFVQSKITLETICISLSIGKYIIPFINRIEFYIQIIEILRNCTPKRSILKLISFPLELGDEEVINLTFFLI